MTLDNGYIRSDKIEEFKQGLDSLLGTEYEFDEDGGFFSGWVSFETSKEAKDYTNLFIKVNGTKHSDANCMNINWEHVDQYYFYVADINGRQLDINIQYYNNTLQLSIEDESILLIEKEYCVKSDAYQAFSDMEKDVDYFTYKLFNVRFPKLSDLKQIAKKFEEC